MTDSAATPVRDASTVVLVRDGPDGIEVFVQRRAGAMAFAAGMTVFPGGAVDRVDADPRPRWVGPGPQEWGSMLGVDAERARMVVVAAVRETFEECGVLLAATADGEIVSDTAPYARHRRAIEDRSLPFADFLEQHALILRTDLMRPWANWITPQAEMRRRYDTRFFVAAAPPGQVADDETSEADDARWCTPVAALEDFAGGRRLLLPPTWAILTGLLDTPTVADVLGRPGDMRPILPVVERVDGAMRIRFDGSDRYYAALPG